MTTNEITQLLQRYGNGEISAFHELLPAIYADLRGIAAHHVRKESAGHTLTPTALVHEAYLKLARSQNPPRVQDRVHFFSVAARAMRAVLVDHARSQSTAKRGGDQVFVTLGTRDGGMDARTEDVLRLDAALDALREMDPTLHTIVELRFFAGLQQAEIASVLQCSERTVKRHWATARAWLLRELRRDGA